MSWAFYDWANNAYATVILTFVFAAYFTRQVAENETVGSAQWGNTIGTAGLIVAICGPIIGAIADQIGRRKPWIVAFTLLCVTATVLLWLVKPSSDYVVLALLLVWLGTVGSEFAMIFYNAMLGTLAKWERLGRWSGWGWSMGYVGGLLCLVVALFAFVRADDPWLGFERQEAEHIRATFVFAAGWYLLFALPLFFITPDTRGTGKRLGQAVGDGLNQLRESIREVRRYAHIVRFLIARIFYTDGLATLFAFGGVYAAGTFDMTEQEVLTFGIAINVAAGLGAAAFAWIDDWIGGKRTILLSLLNLIIWGTLILLVESQLAFWILGMLLGVFVGPVQAASRSFLSRVAPESLRNQMFGLYALSGKATAFMGPLLVGWVTYWTASQRIGMAVIIGYFAIGFILMMTVPAAAKSADRAP